MKRIRVHTTPPGSMAPEGAESALARTRRHHTRLTHVGKILAVASALAAGACAGGDAVSDMASRNPIPPEARMESVANPDLRDPALDPEAALRIDQLPSQKSDVFQRQIPQSAIAARPEDRLTVDQLRQFADRCQAGLPPPAGLDCSGLKLRVERLFRSDDEVARALTVLDRLGTPEESRADQQARLFVQRAIATGALLPEPPPEPAPEEELPDAPVNLIDAIISTTGSQ